MKRAWSILLSVLLGAVVVGVGTGYFLHLANQDRERLANEAQQAKNAAEQALIDRQAAVDEANKKMEQANQEVNKAQTTLQALKFERDMLTKARPLTLPARSQSWPSAVSTGMGMSVRYPSGSHVAANDAYGLSIATSGTSQIVYATTSEPWLSITPFDQTMLNQFETRLASSTEVVFFINGRLLYGISGTVLDGGKSAITGAALSLMANGTSTQLIWIQDPPKTESRPKKNSTPDSWLDVISTLDFEK